MLRARKSWTPHDPLALSISPQSRFRRFFASGAPQSFAALLQKPSLWRRGSTGSAAAGGTGCALTRVSLYDGREDTCARVPR